LIHHFDHSPPHPSYLLTGYQEDILMQEYLLNPMLRRAYRPNTKLNKHSSEFNLYACIYFSRLLEHLETKHKSQEVKVSSWIRPVGSFINK